MASLGQKIRMLRRERKMTQQDLADGLVSASMISQIEADRATPSAKLLDILAARLGVSVAYFTEDIEQKTDLTALHRQARTLIDMERYADAIPLLETLVSPPAPQFRPEVLYGELAECYARQGMLERASETYELVVRSALERDDVPTAVHAYYNLGRYYRRQNQSEMALMYWQRASEMLKRHPEVQMPVAVRIETNLGRLCLALKRYEQALACYRNAARLGEATQTPKEKAVIQHGLATVHAELRRFDEALSAIDAAMSWYEAAEYPRGILQCKINMAFIYRNKGRFRDAVRVLTDCIQSSLVQDDSSQLANAYYERALAWRGLARNDQAVIDANQALEYHPSPALTASLFALVTETHLDLGDYHQVLHYAATAAEAAAAVDDHLLCARMYHIHLQALQRLGRTQEAGDLGERMASAAKRFADKVLLPEK